MEWITLALVALILVCVIASAMMTFMTNATRNRQATQRAEALLRTHLSEHDFSLLQRSGILQVASPNHAGRVYEIRANGGRVSVRSNGAPEFDLCVRTRDPLPGREDVLAHKLMIEAAEDEYLRRANVVWRSGQVVRPGNTQWWMS
jgi:hypothetical protein